jgi:hypothetical protein
MAVLQGGDAGAALPDIDVDQDAERRIVVRQHGAQALELVAMVDHHRHWRHPVEPRQPRGLVRTHHRRGHQQAGDTGLREGLRFQKGRAGDAYGAGLELPERDCSGLVGLGMGTQRDPVGSRGLRHALDVRLKCDLIDDQGGCVDP